MYHMSLYDNHIPVGILVLQVDLRCVTLHIFNILKVSGHEFYFSTIFKWDSNPLNTYSDHWWDPVPSLARWLHCRHSTRYWSYNVRNTYSSLMNITIEIASQASIYLVLVVELAVFLVWTISNWPYHYYELIHNQTEYFLHPFPDWRMVSLYPKTVSLHFSSCSLYYYCFSSTQ